MNSKVFFGFEIIPKRENIVGLDMKEKVTWICGSSSAAKARIINYIRKQYSQNYQTNFALSKFYSN